MAALCGEGFEGWLLSSHVDWLLAKLNGKQNKVLNVLSNFCSVENFKRMEDNIERLNFVMDVGMDADGSVHVASYDKSGSHWVLVSLDLSCNPTVLYCDSLGWKSPTNLLEYLSQFTSVFGITKMERLVMMHIPSDSGCIHQCTSRCHNYPQTCSNVCGLVAVICAVISTLDRQAFQYTVWSKLLP